MAQKEFNLTGSHTKQKFDNTKVLHLVDIPGISTNQRRESPLKAFIKEQYSSSQDPVDVDPVDPDPTDPVDPDPIVNVYEEKTYENDAKILLIKLVYDDTYDDYVETDDIRRYDTLLQVKNVLKPLNDSGDFYRVYCSDDIISSNYDSTNHLLRYDLQECKALYSLRLPSTLKCPYGVCSYCENLTKFQMPYRGDGAWINAGDFVGCTSLKKLDLYVDEFSVASNLQGAIANSAVNEINFLKPFTSTDGSFGYFAFDTSSFEYDNHGRIASVYYLSPNLTVNFANGTTALSIVSTGTNPSAVDYLFTIDEDTEHMITNAITITFNIPNSCTYIHPHFFAVQHDGDIDIPINKYRIIINIDNVEGAIEMPSGSDGNKHPWNITYDIHEEQEVPSSTDSYITVNWLRSS